jgi:hypothetical protein
MNSYRNTAILRVGGGNCMVWGLANMALVGPSGLSRRSTRGPRAGSSRRRSTSALGIFEAHTRAHDRAMRADGPPTPATCAGPHMDQH